MFNWSYEDSMEVDAPLQVAWDFYTNPTNWPKWEERFESCFLEGELKTGSKVKAKIKSSLTQILILVTEVKPYQECKCLIKMMFFTQESLCIFHEISPGKTRITLKMCVISLFVPFMKGFFLKAVEKSYAKRLHALAAVAGMVR